MSTNATQSLQSLLTLEHAIWLLGRLCLILAVYFVFETGVTLERLTNSEIEAPSFSEASDVSEPSPARNRASYAIITNRNLFSEPKEAATTTTSTTPSELKLRLVGTYVGTAETSFAVLEDDKGKQDLFDLNEEIFGSATLLEVMEESVRVAFNGSEITLELEQGAGGADGDSSSGDGESFTVPEEELEEALNNLPRLLSQARAVPYFRNGKSIGMRLFAIRRDSLYEKLGLKNGDIILEVNGNSVNDPSQALKLFEQLKSERSIQVQVERRGEKRALSYDIQ